MEKKKLFNKLINHQGDIIPKLPPCYYASAFAPQFPICLVAYHFLSGLPIISEHRPKTCAPNMTVALSLP